jgi:hypothetical protein
MENEVEDVEPTTKRIESVDTGPTETEQPEGV